MTDDLEQMLRKRAAPVPVPDALMARILADAAREQPRPAAAVAQRPPPRAGGLWQALSDLFGGGGVLAGLASLACLGVYLGAAPPSALAEITQVWAGSSVVDELDFMPSIDTVLAGE